MKRSFSPDPFSPAKQVHRCDDGAGRLVDPITVTLTDENPVCFRNPKKTFHVDPFPHIPKRDNKLYLEEAWGMLKPAIKMIFLDEDEPASFNCTRIIRAVSRACLTGLGRELFHRIRDECEPFISADIQSLEKQSSDPSVFLPLAEKCWLGFRRKMMLVSDIAMYETCDGKSLWDMGKELFKKQLSMASQVEEKTIAGILELITDERLGKTGENMSSLLKNLMDMFRGESGIFEKRLIDSTSEFYAKKSKEVLQQSDLSQYMIYVEGVLHEEWIKRNKPYYFFAICWIQLMEVLNRELLEVHACVFEKGFTVLMDEGRVEDLRRMYGLFSGAGMVGYMDRVLRSYIREEVARDGCSLTELMSRIDRMWHRCFEEDHLLHKSIRECFEGLGIHLPGEVEEDVDDEETYVDWED